MSALEIEERQKLYLLAECAESIAGDVGGLRKEIKALVNEVRHFNQKIDTVLLIHERLAALESKVTALTSGH